MGEAYFIVTEEQLRAKIIELSPEIRHDTNRMEDLIRELVSIEREKAGLDHPGGHLELWLNKERRTETDPQWIGTGRVAGRHYRASAWVKEQTLRVALIIRKP